MKTIPYLAEAIEKLRKNTNLSKHSHFEASKRSENYHLWMGVPIVLINIFLGSVLFGVFKNNLPEWGTLLGGFLAFCAAALGGMQTFFNFKANSQGHRAVANQYLVIARECEYLLAGYFDDRISLDELSRRLNELNKLYDSVNREAEKFMVKEADFLKAKAAQQDKEIKEPSILERVKLANADSPQPTK